MLNLLLLLPLAFPALQDPAPAPEPAHGASADSVEEGAPAFEILPLDGLAARAYTAEGPSTVVTFAELDPVLLERHGQRPEGQDVLTRLLNAEILRSIAVAKGVEITDAVVDARIAELDALLAEQGIEGGLAGQLVEADVDPVVFRDSMRLSLMQEELVRLSLGLPEGERPGVGPQNAWMDETLGKRQTQIFNDPFPTGPGDPVATSDEVTITLATFLEHLHDELPRPFVEQSITQLVLEKNLRALAGPIDAATWNAALDLEMQRRRERHQANPQTQGIGYEQLLEAQGLSIEILKRDPAVVVTALTTVLAWQRSEEAALENGADPGLGAEALRDAGLRALYQADQELFDGHFGEQLFLSSCVLRAQEVPDETVTRSLAEARKYLADLGPGIVDKQAFEMIVERISEDVKAAETKGALGYVGRMGSGLPEEIVELVFGYWDTKGEPGVVGPVDIPGGVALFWVGPHEPAPGWDVMAQAVQADLQSRLLNEALPEGGIHIFRDPPPTTAPAPGQE